MDKEKLKYSGDEIPPIPVPGISQVRREKAKKLRDERKRRRTKES
jgi:hypothetical protein